MRTRRKWASGTRLVVEEHPEGVLLREERIFPPTRIEDVAGMLSGPGPILTVEEMDEAVAPSSVDVLAIDTNIVARVLRRDDAEQAERAIWLVSHEDVLLLTKWCWKRRGCFGVATSCPRLG